MVLVVDVELHPSFKKYIKSFFMHKTKFFSCNFPFFICFNPLGGYSRNKTRPRRLRILFLRKWVWFRVGALCNTKWTGFGYWLITSRKFWNKCKDEKKIKNSNCEDFQVIFIKQYYIGKELNVKRLKKLFYLFIVLSHIYFTSSFYIFKYRGIYWRKIISHTLFPPFFGIFTF